MYKITVGKEGVASKMNLTGTEIFGTPITCPEKGSHFIIGYEGGITQTYKGSSTLIESTVFAALAKCCYSYHFCLGDYKELFNLIVWCWNHEVPSDEVVDLLGEWEGTHGPHVDYDWYQELVTALAWRW